MKATYISKLIIGSTTIALLLSACGGGSDASFSNAEIKTDIIDCNATTVDNYTVMNSGDTLIKTVTPTTIKTYHDTDDNKRYVSKKVMHIFLANRKGNIL